MVSDAQKRANAKYREKVKQVVVRFYPNSKEDEAVYAHLKSQPRMGEYVKRLVMEDMERAKR